MRIFAHMLTWNDRRYLPDLFESIERQTFRDFTLRVLDNGSSDGTIEYLQKYYPHAVVSRNVKNNGFAGGHNQLLKFTIDHLEEKPEETFVLIMNSDMILDAHVLERLVKALKRDSELGAVQPKLYRAFGENVGNEVLEETIQSDILDTAGMRLGKGWRMSDRGAGELDDGQYDDKTDIFGITGTMALFRLEALLDVQVNGEIFDEDFFAYREDCDLVWRLRKAGWKAAFVPDALAWHYRGMYGAERQSWLDRIRNRRSQRPFFAALSTRNQLLMLLKNLTVGDIVHQLPFLFVGEGVRTLYGFLFERQTRKRLLSIPKLLPKMWKKRKAIKEKTRVPASDIRQYVS